MLYISMIVAATWMMLITKLKITPIKVKPFNCSLCMAFWTTLFIGIYQQEYLLAFFYAGFSAYLTQLLNKLLIP